MSNSASRKGGGDLVLDDLDLRADADDRVAVLDRRDPADVDADRGVELQGAAARRRFGVAEHHADLLADLVDEDERRLRLRDDRGQLAQGLGHQARLKAHVRVAHLALDLGLGDERGDRVDDDHIDRVGAHEHLGDFQRLFAGVRLRDQQVVDVDAELAGVLGVECVLGVDEGRDAAGLLGLAMTCSARVVLPEDSGPKISTTRPRGMPPTPGPCPGERAGGDDRLTCSGCLRAA